jgi:hypothetical protein
MRISAHAAIDIPRPREAVFDFACAAETFERLFRPRGLVAGIQKIVMLEGAPLAAGARRQVTMSDGGALVEEVTAFERPLRHAYRWAGGLRAPAKFFVRAGEGDWRFSDAAGGTHIDWTYTFELTTPLAYPAAALLRLQFRAWMAQQLRAIAAAL